MTFMVIGQSVTFKNLTCGTDFMDSLRKGWVIESFKIVKFVYFGIMELKKFPKPI